MEKEYNLKPVKLRKGNPCAYNINYHIVFCPKYRKKVLFGKIKTSLERIFKNIIEEKSWNLIDLTICIDHIHMFISAHPKFSPTYIVKTLKGISARLIFQQYPDFQKKEFWGRHLWSGGYYVGTAGVITSEAIQKYIQANSSNQ